MATFRHVTVKCKSAKVKYIKTSLQNIVHVLKRKREDVNVAA